MGEALGELSSIAHRPCKDSEAFLEIQPFRVEKVSASAFSRDDNNVVLIPREQASLRQLKFDSPRPGGINKSLTYAQKSELKQPLTSYSKALGKKVVAPLKEGQGVE
jgi:hypothetical protein